MLGNIEVINDLSQNGFCGIIGKETRLEWTEEWIYGNEVEQVVEVILSYLKK